MRVGVVREVKSDEYRVALTPVGVRELHSAGHQVVIETGAGLGSALPDAAYEEQGARIVASPDEVFAEADLMVGVKEPQPDQVAMLRPGQILFTYLHLAADRDLTLGLCASGATCVAYETIVGADGSLPLLAPMSHIAGKLATQAGASVLERPRGGRGILLGGVPGVAPARVVVIGGGVVGRRAAQIALGMGAHTTVLDKSIARLHEIEMILGERCATALSSELALEELLPGADLIVGAALSPGARAPIVVRKDQLASLKRHAVLVDVSIDQGGCFETSRPTTHRDPTYEVDGVVHYCVANMPGAVPVTSTWALTNATLPYVRALADGGFDVLGTPLFDGGLNVHSGHVVYAPVAAEHGLDAAGVTD